VIFLECIAVGCCGKEYGCELKF